MIITLQYILWFIAGIVLTGFALALETSHFANNYPQKKLRHWQIILVTLLVVIIIYLCFLNFPLSLTLLVIVTGIIALIDQIFFAKKRNLKKQTPGIMVENARGFFPVLLLVWVIRSFIVQPYHVPTGSLEPTIIPGDFIAVNQFAYGLRFPVLNTKMVSIGEPKIGDIVLFYYPVDPAIVFIKRLVGGPGDHVVYKDKVLYVNGKKAPQQLLGTGQDVEPDALAKTVYRKSEDLNGIKHEIFVQDADQGETQNIDVVVPPGMYFMMGDNRDDSDDSRIWGFVPEANIIGKAFATWMSWDSDNNRIRWDRIGKMIH